MTSVRTSTTVQRRAEEVFAYLTDPHRRPEWLGSCEEVREVPDVMEPGVSWVDVAKGQRETRVTLAGYEPDRRYVEQIDMSIGEFEIEVELEPDGASTVVAARAEGEPKGIWKALFPLMKPVFRRQFESDIERARERIEQGAGA